MLRFQLMSQKTVHELPRLIPTSGVSCCWVPWPYKWPCTLSHDVSPQIPYCQMYKRASTYLDMVTIHIIFTDSTDVNGSASLQRSYILSLSSSSNPRHLYRLCQSQNRNSRKIQCTYMCLNYTTYMHNDTDTHSKPITALRPHTMHHILYRSMQ